MNGVTLPEPALRTTMETSDTKNPRTTIIDLLFYFYTIIWWLEIGQRIEFLGKIRFEFWVGAVLGLFAVFRLIQGKVPGLNNPIIKATLLYLLILLASLPLSVDIALSWDIYINRVIKLAMMAFFMLVFTQSVFQLKLFLASSFIAFFKVGYEALHGKITGSMVWENQGVMRLHGAPETMFGHPNSLSGKFLGLLPFIWYLFPLVRRKWKILLVMVLVFMGNIVIFTASRTGYLTFLLVCIFISFRSRNKFKVLALFIAFLAIAAVMVPDQYKERFLSTFTGEEKEGRSSETRIGLLKDSLNVFIDNPLGVGMGGFSIVQAIHGRTAQETHNLYTQILSETGLQGFAAFSILIFTILRQIRRRVESLDRTRNEISTYLGKGNCNHEDRLSAERSLAEANFLLNVCHAVAVFLVVRLILGVFGSDLFEIYWWIAAGMVMAVGTCGERCLKDFRAVKMSTES